MWGADEESYRQEVIDEAAGYVTKDSGEKAVHTDGVQRDTNRGKTLYQLMFPKGVPKDEQLIVRLANLYTRGAEKYGDRNWENSSAEDTLEHHLDALWRHFMNYYFEVDDGEDHAAAILWNVNAVDLTRRNIKKKALIDAAEEAGMPSPPSQPARISNAEAAKIFKAQAESQRKYGWPEHHNQNVEVKS
jgi:hypothetical protein